jgi:hypothetical protein
MRRHTDRYVSSFLCWTSFLVPLARLIAVAVTRWKIEEDHQLSKRVSGCTAARSPADDPRHHA